VRITNEKRMKMSRKGIQWCKCVEGAEGCVYRSEKKGKRRRRKNRRLYSVIIVVVDDISMSCENSAIEGNSDTYEEYMARNERYHMYLEEEHPRH
jgi:hypothetical protein